MIHFIYGADLWSEFPTAAAEMFRDRAEQFHRRLGWDVQVDAQGFERDEYDANNPLYVIFTDRAGRHAGSMRLLPTSGETMVNDIFPHLAGGKIQSPRIWECTRFCLAPSAPATVAAALFLACAQIAKNFAVDSCLGVFDARMVRIYSRLGSSPEILGSEGHGRQKISVGLWHYCPQVEADLAEKIGLSVSEVAEDFHISFPSFNYDGGAA